MAKLKLLREDFAWTAIKYVFLTALLFIVIFPIFWLIISAFKFERQIVTFPPTVFGTAYTFENFVRIFNTIPIANYLINTVIFAVGSTFFALIFDSMAGYAFARLHFRGKDVLFIIILLSMMVPFQVIMIPLFLQVHFLGILNTYPGLIIPRTTMAFGIFMMRSYFSQLPKDLEEAARIDGLSEFGIYFRVMLPLVKPGIMTLGIFYLMTHWNDLLYPMMMTSSPRMRTLAAGLAMFVGERATLFFGAQLAGAVISIIPLLILYVFFQKYFVASVASSGLKD